jgi:hypothetical protein
VNTSYCVHAAKPLTKIHRAPKRRSWLVALRPVTTIGNSTLKQRLPQVEIVRLIHTIPNFEVQILSCVSFLSRCDCKNCLLGQPSSAGNTFQSYHGTNLDWILPLLKQWSTKARKFLSTSSTLLLWNGHQTSKTHGCGSGATLATPTRNFWINVYQNSLQNLTQPLTKHYRVFSISIAKRHLFIHACQAWQCR